MMNTHRVNTDITEREQMVYDIMNAATVIEDPDLNLVKGDLSTMDTFNKIMLENFTKPFFCGKKEHNSNNNMSVACAYFVKLATKIPKVKGSTDDPQKGKRQL